MTTRYPNTLGTRVYHSRLYFFAEIEELFNKIRIRPTAIYIPLYNFKYRFAACRLRYF